MYRGAIACSFAALAGLAGLFACGSSGYPLAPVEVIGAGGGGGAGSGAGGGSGFDAGVKQGPPAADAGGLCGNQIHAITTVPPTVYFIFDISGSMSTPVPGGTRFSVVQSAAASLVESLALLVKVGAAAFPGQTSPDSCQIGGEIYPPTFGNPAAFDDATRFLVPNGGTPTAATLASLQPELVALAALPGKTVAVLATDGGPNCDAAAMCDISECSENIDGCSPGDTCCATDTNCCVAQGPNDPYAAERPLNCVDVTATVAALTALHTAGIDVSIIGIPGSESYANVLTDMAFAGGAPQSAAPFYYAVEDLGTLGAIFAGIAGAGISCDITIADPPSTQDETNVYLGQTLIDFDPTNGWTWSAPDVVTLHGTACAELRSGLVSQVQVVSGCPTQVTK
jgi:hypothetical protein